MKPKGRYEQPRFRPTVWPGEVIEIPPVIRGYLEHIDERGFLHWKWTGESLALVDELAIRELQELDTDDDDAVVAFMERFGTIAGPFDLIDNRPEFYDPADVPEHARASRPGWAVNHLDDARAYLQTAQALGRHWLLATAGEDPSPAWDHRISPKRPLGVADEEGAWLSFATYLNLGLRRFHVRVELELFETEVGGWGQGGLYAALCLQVANLLVEDLGWRRCANEPCGQPFVRQRGRAEHGQYRTTGVRYCSKSCAKAQGERERRRKIKSRNEGQ